MELEIWRLHPGGVRIVAAEKTLGGTAHTEGVKWCGPFSTSNALGWWVFPPLDFDVLWRGGKTFEHKILQEYTDQDYHDLRGLIRPEDGVDPTVWSPPGGRTKFTWGAVEPGVAQVWTGCIFRTPPGWGLQVRSPINFPQRPFYIQEGILETDWLQYDIWLNLKFTRKNRWAFFRRNEFPPLAQLVPIRRDVYDPKWTATEGLINRDDPESEKIFKFWVNYNRQKYESGGNQFLTPLDLSLKKDSTTYHRVRKAQCPLQKDDQ